MKNTEKLIVAFLAGAATGALLGVLFAPGKGTETREKIRSKGKETADDIQDIIAKGREKLEKMKDEFLQKVFADTEEEEVNS